MYGSGCPSNAFSLRFPRGDPAPAFSRAADWLFCPWSVFCGQNRQGFRRDPRDDYGLYWRSPLLAPSPLWAIVSSNADPNSIFDGVNVNQLIGAETFYLNGYFGDRAIIANVEAGNVWNGHQTLPQVNTYINDPSIGSDPTAAGFPFDWHATMVGETLVGRLDLNVSLAPGVIYTIPAPYSYFYTATASDGTQYNWSAFTGIAPNATLWSSAVSTGWIFSGTNEYSGSFNTDTQQVPYAYANTMQTGLPLQPGQPNRHADVINSSWGYDDATGTFLWTQIVDSLAYANHNTVVMAAGNSGGGQVGGPASGFNTIAVSAMTSDTSTPPYGSVASFSSSGPNDFYNPQTGITIPGVRASVAIAAPGDNLTLAFYGGLTGGHSPTGADPTNGSGYYYAIDNGGTSFSSPIVAGGAALVIDAGYANFGGGNAVDGRVIKAVLLNSADKTPGWNNGQVQNPVSLVISTTQNLDYAVGAGVIDLNKAYSQYLSGTTDPGLTGSQNAQVRPIGWDFGTVSPSRAG